MWKHDLRRNHWLAEHGWAVVHTTDDEVWSEREALISYILQQLATR